MGVGDGAFFARLRVAGTCTKVPYISEKKGDYMIFRRIRKRAG